MALAGGARLGPYEILSALGAGGMGEVYRARDTRLGRDLAIKILPTEMAADPDRLCRFEKEARLASSLNHPNIVTIYDIGWSGTIPYMAMELVGGSTVRDLLRAGPLSTRHILDVTTQIADGLAKAHEAGIVHRDLKPANVMVTADGLVKILDFGLGKQVVSFAQATADTIPAATPVTIDGRILGTVDYMSPEQAVGKPVDFRSDQFSFGSLLCEMATGTPPFRRDTSVQTLSAILDAPPRLPPNLAEPDALGRIVRRCLEKDPEQRYASTRMLASELRGLMTRSTAADTAISDVHVPPPRSFDMKYGLVALLMLAILAGIVGLIPSALSTVFDFVSSTAGAPMAPSPGLFRPTVSPIIPYWSLSVLNLIVLLALATTLVAFDRRSPAVRAFVVVLVLRGIVGVTATLGDGASFTIARWAVPLDAATSTLLSGALTIFVLLYPRRRRWAGPVVFGTIALVTLVLAGLALAVPSTLGVFTIGSNGRLAVVSAGPLLSERGWYINAMGVAAAILAVEHAKLTRPALRRSVLLVGIALVVFPVSLGVTLVALGPAVSRSVFVGYGNAAFALLYLSLAIAIVAAAAFAATEVRRGDWRSAAGTLLACGIAAASGIVGIRFGGAPTIAGSVSFVLRGLWRFPLPILATYALLRHQLLGIDVHLKWTIRRGTLAAIFVAVFVVVATIVRNLGSALLAYMMGAVAAGLLLLVLEPLRGIAERLANAALPRARDPRAAPPTRRLEAYRQTAELMLADGILTPRKERALAALADELGIGAIEALEMRERALAKS